MATQKSRKTKSEIERAFLTLMQDKRWDKLSVREICCAAGITRGTFYQYFNDLYDLTEQIESALLADLAARYEPSKDTYGPVISLDFFPDKFDFSPPTIFLNWYEFCQEHKLAMIAFLDRKNGDTYFVKRLRALIESSVSLLMDHDGMPRDDLRNHFLHLISEMHFLSAQSWLSETDPEAMLSVDDIVNLLNTMRVGSVFLAWKSKN